MLHDPLLERILHPITRLPHLTSGEDEPNYQGIRYSVAHQLAGVDRDSAAGVKDVGDVDE